MLSHWESLVEYFFELKSNWWLFSMGGIVALLKGYEWFFREGRSLPIPAKWRYTLAAMALFAAQFFAYRDLRLRSLTNSQRLNAQVLSLNYENGRLNQIVRRKRTTHFGRKQTDDSSARMGSRCTGQPVFARAKERGKRSGELYGLVRCLP